MLDSPVAGGCILALMLSIGRFADATGLTVKALRHYDEIGLLEPARVDPNNGYRYYDAAQIEDAVTIRRLRALELPLDEIRELLRADAHALRDRLAAHGYRVAEEVRDKHSLLIELSALVEGGAEPVVVQIRDEPVLHLAATIRHLRLVDPEGVAEMLQLACHRLARRGIAPAGPPTALFRSGDGNGTHLVEAGYPVAAGVQGDGLLRVTMYPASSAATVDHFGSYDGLHVTAQRFIATALGQGLRFAQPIRIEYLEPDVRARIVWPLASVIYAL
jgi:DNA-binding transcriptional MerR regulator